MSREDSSSGAEPSSMMQDQKAEQAKKDARLKNFIFGQLREILHGKIVITYHQYDVIYRCLDNYKGQFGVFKNRLDKEKDKELITQIDVAIGKIESLRSNLDSTNKQMVKLRDKIFIDSLYKETAGADQKTIQVDDAKLQKYVALATSVLTNPVFSTDLLRSMTYLQLLGSHLGKDIQPVYQQMAERDANELKKIREVNNAMLKFHFAQVPGLRESMGIDGTGEISLPRGLADDPLVFLTNPLGKTSGFYTGIELCLQAYLKESDKISEKTTEIKACEAQVGILMGIAKEIAKHANELTPSSEAEHHVESVYSYQQTVRDLKEKEKDSVARFQELTKAKTQADEELSRLRDEKNRMEEELGRRRSEQERLVEEFEQQSSRILSQISADDISAIPLLPEVEAKKDQPEPPQVWWSLNSIWGGGAAVSSVGSTPPEQKLVDNDGEEEEQTAGEEFEQVDAEDIPVEGSAQTTAESSVPPPAQAGGSSFPLLNWWLTKEQGQNSAPQNKSPVDESESNVNGF